MQNFDGAWSMAPKLCCSCNSAAAALYCHTHSAFLCLSCDAQIHSHTRHPRVWLCEVCEQAPAAITCNADAAALCLACDADVHSVNPLARRHDRSPIQPFLDSHELAVKPTPAFKFFISDDVVLPELKSEDIFFPEMNSLFDFEFPTGDGVVPDQSEPAADDSAGDFCARSKLDSVSETHFDFSENKSPEENLYSVSSSSLDVGVVPDGNTASDESCPSGQAAVPAAAQLRGMDREARVLRYREKKKNRRFEKTIRYASRKAYAEIRPRIKGRFVKRTEPFSQVERIFGSFRSSVSSEGPYGVVPIL